MNGLNPIEFNNLNGLMEIYADNLNTLKINNLEIDESLTLSGNINIPLNNSTITPTNTSYCDATSSFFKIKLIIYRSNYIQQQGRLL